MVPDTSPERMNTITRYEFVNLGMMLLLLHLALHQATHNTPLLLSLLLAHIGFFLLWQPALNASEKIEAKTLLPILLVNSLLYFLLRDWYLAIWIILLTGLTSGSALVKGFQRSIYALAAVILFLELSLVLTPTIFNLEVLDPELDRIIFYTLILACLVIVFWPSKKNRLVRIDYLHSLLISFGLFSFYITSILISFTNEIHYLQSLLLTAVSLALFLLLISSIWLPQHGLASIGQLWEQYILNIGNPFENWVKQTSLLSNNKKVTPDLFLDNSIKQLLTLSWVSGIHWKDHQHEASYGEKSSHSISFQDGDITIELHSLIPMGSALKIHAQLLLHLMCYFYTSKLREITLKNQTHLKAVYETGSKLTHDIKNLLQSLQTLTTIVVESNEPEESHKLIEKQLPLLTQRLQNTLDKLQARTDTDKSISALDTWWKELQSRYHGRNIQFKGKPDSRLSIDTNVFDTVLENLLENARNKRRTDPGIDIVTQLTITGDAASVSVCDSGECVSEEKLAGLFRQIVPSKDGYGIGLYQSAQLASRNGYTLRLIHNTHGNICFELAPSEQQI